MAAQQDSFDAALRRHVEATDPEGAALLVTGAGSLWTNSSELRVGSVGGGSQLVVSNGGVAASASYNFV